MKAITYRITTLSPIILTSRTGDPNMVSTLDYIPGTHIRGIFAHEYLNLKQIKFGENAEEDERFYNWFINGKLKFLNAYPSLIKDDQVLRLYPIPLSIQVEKGSEPEKSKTVYDLLVNQRHEKKTQTIDGFCKIDGKYLFRHRVKKSLNFHHARNRERGVSEENLIFNYESIDTGQMFDGFIIGEESELKEFLNIFSNGIYYTGRSRNNQYGKIHLEFLSKEPVEFDGEVIENSINSEFLILTLLSDTIVYNEFGYSTCDLRDFEKYIGFKIKKAYIRTTEEEGYNSVWRVKTPSESCFKAGSCFLISIENTSQISKLRQLQMQGIGEYTHLGFGRFSTDLQREEKYFVEEEKSPAEKNKKPPQMSKLTKSLLTQVAENHITTLVETEAIDKAKLNSSLKKDTIPPKSLLYKLERAIKDDSLSETLKSLKDIAKKNLESFIVDEKTLYDYLLTFKLSIREIVNKNVKIREFCNEISFNTDEESLQKRLQKTYLITFLSTLRKISKNQLGRKQ